MGEFKGYNIAGLLKNWLRIKSCVEDPGKNNVCSMPSPEAADFVLRLTDRSFKASDRAIVSGMTTSNNASDQAKAVSKSPAIPTFGHSDIRRHAIMQHLELPTSRDTTLAWLETSLQTPPLPW